MAVSETLKGTLPQVQKTTGEVKYSLYIVAALLLMTVLLGYVASHLQMTKLEYQIAEEMSRKEKLLEEQKKLKLEIATLKAPQRIAAIAAEKLQMRPPDKDQIILIK
ncbi:MAG TPA: cell division protein FtsL [Syntrophales bacterium]|jgi:cell division protein FtsL|nr:cell division protein FtsL [Syntrophales bacterium]HON22179.1 cell division protein FtsL [Syntrophales bacterium]HOU77387.1 cell division protein FtsL [Syntrophales bacterium]HPC32491.1 cell division protein FtsL [Syntrophales bacterium]HQG34112.1 cell division protein FtsL [Syntrophales bacterium]